MKSLLFFLADNVEIEIMEYGPEASQHKAMQALQD